jgi:homoserine dehydrogenase
LKFGGSVLRDEDSLRLAVHEIYRWRRDGYGVVPVVSALNGVTDVLLGRSQRLCERAAPASIAALASIGELQSAALLGLHLDRAGIPASVLTPDALRLVARGPSLDAAPLDACVCSVQRGLHRDGVVVIAGYVAEDADGRAVVLGRGGSDLTALFVAHRLSAQRCRLIKDVEGLYERDPAQAGPPPRRYARASWADALATDGSIIQHKAVRFAASYGIRFELGGLNGCAPTLIGDGSTAFAEPDRPRRRWRVALLGLGVVGVGVYEALRRLEPLFEVVSVAVRDVAKLRGIDVPETLLSNRAESVVGRDVDLVIEVMGGVEPAGAVVEAALARGVHVVTANKRLIAERGERLRSLAASHDCRLLYSAAVGGSVPLLERVRENGAAAVRSIRAVLNGTTNFVLDRIAEGDTFAEAVSEAQRLGLAEADPSRDLDGRDAGDKLCVLAGELGLKGVGPERVHREPLTPELIAARRKKVQNGHVLRHVATLRGAGDEVEADVRLTSLESTDDLASVHGEHNAAVIERADGRCDVVRGKGAGRWPTAEVVIADVLEIVRGA